MSIDQAKLFSERMTKDPAFHERVMAIKDVAQRIAYIKSEGFDCSETEINAVSAELSDEELDAAAGGSEFSEFNYTFN